MAPRSLPGTFRYTLTTYCLGSGSLLLTPKLAEALALVPPVLLWGRESYPLSVGEDGRVHGLAPLFGALGLTANTTLLLTPTPEGLLLEVKPSTRHPEAPSRSPRGPHFSSLPSLSPSSSLPSQEGGAHTPWRVGRGGGAGRGGVPSQGAPQGGSASQEGQRGGGLEAPRADGLRRLAPGGGGAFLALPEAALFLQGEALARLEGLALQPEGKPLPWGRCSPSCGREGALRRPGGGCMAEAAERRLEGPGEAHRPPPLPLGAPEGHPHRHLRGGGGGSWGSALLPALAAPPLSLVRRTVTGYELARPVEEALLDLLRYADSLLALLRRRKGRAGKGARGLTAPSPQGRER